MRTWRPLHEAAIKEVGISKLWVLSRFLLEMFPRHHFVSVVTLVPIISNCQVGTEFGGVPVSDACSECSIDESRLILDGVVTQGSDDNVKTC